MHASPTIVMQNHAKVIGAYIEHRCTSASCRARRSPCPHRTACCSGPSCRPPSPWAARPPPSALGGRLGPPPMTVFLRAGCPLAMWGPPSGAWGAARFGWLTSRCACARAAVGAKPAGHVSHRRWARRNWEAAESPAGRRAARVPRRCRRQNEGGSKVAFRPTRSARGREDPPGAFDWKRPQRTPPKPATAAALRVRAAGRGSFPLQRRCNAGTVNHGAPLGSTRYGIFCDSPPGRKTG